AFHRQARQLPALRRFSRHASRQAVPPLPVVTRRAVGLPLRSRARPPLARESPSSAVWKQAKIAHPEDSSRWYQLRGRVVRRARRVPLASSIHAASGDALRREYSVPRGPWRRKIRAKFPCRRWKIPRATPRRFRNSAPRDPTALSMKIAPYRPGDAHHSQYVWQCAASLLIALREARIFFAVALVSCRTRIQYTTLFSGYSTIPSAPAAFSLGINWRTVFSSTIVLMASHPGSLSCALVGLRSAGSAPSTLSRSSRRKFSIRPTRL